MMQRHIKLVVKWDEPYFSWPLIMT